MLGLGTRSIENWPEKSRESAQRIIAQFGEPDEVTNDQLIWRKRGPWRQIIAAKCLYQHNFPAPHYALLELEPHDDKEFDRKPRRAAAKKATTLAQVAAVAPIAIKATHAKADFGKSMVAKPAVGKARKPALVTPPLAKAPLRKSSIGKATLALRKSSTAPANSSAA
jgi:hypothetical protein